MLDKILAALMVFAAPETAIAPPPQYQNTVDLPIPDQFKGNTTVKVQFEHPLIVEWYCNDGAYHPDYFIYACYIPGKKTIVMPNPCDYPEARLVGSYAHLMCHEKAHVVGWKH